MANPFPRLKPKRRWMQVSLRTMLVFVTMLCVALSVSVVPHERQRRAVKAISALGGTVAYNGDLSEIELWRTDRRRLPFLRRWLPPEYFHEVVHVVFNDPKITDAGLVHLQGLKYLQILSLDDTQVTDAGAVHCKG